MRHSPRRAVALALGAKMLALGLIYALFFSPSHRPDARPDAIARALLSEDAP